MIDPQEEENESRNVNEGLNFHGKEKWIKEMEEEMKSMKLNQVWEFVDLFE